MYICTNYVYKYTAGSTNNSQTIVVIVTLRSERNFMVSIYMLHAQYVWNDLHDNICPIQMQLRKVCLKLHESES